MLSRARSGEYEPAPGCAVDAVVVCSRTLQALSLLCRRARGRGLAGEVVLLRDANAIVIDAKAARATALEAENDDALAWAEGPNGSASASFFVSSQFSAAGGGSAAAFDNWPKSNVSPSSSSPSPSSSPSLSVSVGLSPALALARLALPRCATHAAAAAAAAAAYGAALKSAAPDTGDRALAAVSSALVAGDILSLLTAAAAVATPVACLYRPDGTASSDADASSSALIATAERTATRADAACAAAIRLKDDATLAHDARIAL